MYTGMHSSSSQSTDTFDSTGGPREQIYSPSHPRSAFSDYDPYAKPQRWQMKKQPSQDQLSVSSSWTTGSGTTFEEVESIDFGGHHDVEIEPSFRKQLEGERQRQREDSAGEQIPGEVRRRGDIYEVQSSTSTEDSLGKSSKHSRRWNRGIFGLGEEEEDPYQHLVKSYRDSSDQSIENGPRVSRTRWSKDLSHQRSLMEQLLQYKDPHMSHPPSDSLSTSSSVYPPSSGTGSSEHILRYPFENEYEYHVRKRQVSPSGQSSGTQSGSASMSRTMSLESSSSSSPSDLGGGMYSSQIPAEDVLVNLGFCTADSFLPERFARNWFDKIMNARRERIQQLQQQEFADMLESNETVSRIPSGRSTPRRPRRRSIVDFVHQLDANSRELGSTRRSRFRRAASVLTYHQSDSSQNLYEKAMHIQKGREGSHGSHIQDLEKQDSIDQLKFILERQQKILHGSNANTIKDRRRKQFASTRQKSLPLCLETLSEEDEGKLSRGSNGTNGHLKSFLEEELLSSSSSKDSDFSRAGDTSENRSKTCRLSANSAGSSEEKFPLIEIIQSQSHKDNKSDSSIKPINSASSQSSDQEADREVREIQHKKDGQECSEVYATKQKVPAIVVSSNRNFQNQSSCSLEIAEIMDTQLEPLKKSKVANSKHLQPEPAMISVILSDLEDSYKSTENSQSLLPPSSPLAMSLSMSPIPVSPVTVIEVEHLDNQNDSIDSGDALPADTSDIHGVLMIAEDNIEGINNPPAILHPIFEEESMMSSDQSHSASFDDGLSSHPSELPQGAGPHQFSPLTMDSAVEATDGRLSPLIMFTSGMELNLDYLTEAFNLDPRAEAISETWSEEPKVDQSMSCSESTFQEDIGLQADNGALSPIMFNPIHYDDNWRMDDHRDVSLVSNSSNQYDCQVTSCNRNNMSTQTDQILDTSKTSCETQTQDWGFKASLSWQTTEEFEPMCVYCSVGTQTDKILRNNFFTSLRQLPGCLESKLHNYFLCSNCAQIIRVLTQSTIEETDTSVNESTSMSQSSSAQQAEDISQTSSSDSLSGYAGRCLLDATINRLSRKTKIIQKRTELSSNIIERQRYSKGPIDINKHKKNIDNARNHRRKSTSTEITQQDEKCPGNIPSASQQALSGSAEEGPQHSVIRTAHITAGPKARRPHIKYRSKGSISLEECHHKLTGAAERRRASDTGTISGITYTFSPYQDKDVKNSISRGNSEKNSAAFTKGFSHEGRRSSLLRQQCLESFVTEQVAGMNHDVYEHYEHSAACVEDSKDPILNLPSSRSPETTAVCETTSAAPSSSSNRHYTGSPERSVDASAAPSSSSNRNYIGSPKGSLDASADPSSSNQHYIGSTKRSVDASAAPSSSSNRNCIGSPKGSLDASADPSSSNRNYIGSPERSVDASVDSSSSDRNYIGSKEQSGSPEGDPLASSIMTDVFQSVGLGSGASTAKVLQEIALDYAMLKAVNETLDLVFPTSTLELSPPLQGMLLMV